MGGSKRKDCSTRGSEEGATTASAGASLPVTGSDDRVSSSVAATAYGLSSAGSDKDDSHSSPCRGSRTLSQAAGVDEDNANIFTTEDAMMNSAGERSPHMGSGDVENSSCAPRAQPMSLPLCVTEQIVEVCVEDDGIPVYDADDAGCAGRIMSL